MEQTDPANGVLVITPSNTAIIQESIRAIRVSVGGDVKITFPNGQVAVCAFNSGETRQIRAKIIWATGTTATTIEAMY